MENILCSSPLEESVFILFLKGTCNKIRVVLGMLDRWTYEEGITLTNKADNLSTAAKQFAVREIFLDADIKAMKKSKLPAADIALILISCGGRPGELFEVPLADCFDDYFIGGSKTEAGKDRVIPIGPEGLSAYRKIREKAAGPEGHDPLQLSPDIHHQCHQRRHGSGSPGSGRRPCRP